MRSQDKPELKPTRKLTRDDVLFAAGFYEGEGCVFRPKKDSGIAVVCGQTDPEILYRIRDVFGGSVHKQNASKSSWQQGFIFRWLIGGDRARNFLREVFPYLSTRRKEQAIKAGFDPESVTTVRPASSDGTMIQSELHGNMQSSSETKEPIN